jgi:hypothetical protein
MLERAAFSRRIDAGIRYRAGEVGSQDRLIG